ncbi:MAG: DoxX family protein [archaeon]|nr:DoxX family protein [archaeon]
MAFEFLVLIGRILFGGFFINSGINHLTKREGMAQYAQSKGVPAAKFFVVVSGLMILLAGLYIVFGVWPQVGVLLIAAFLLPVSLVMHNFWSIKDPQQKMTEMISFMKNMALLGAALMFLGIATPWAFSLF